MVEVLGRDPVAEAYRVAAVVDGRRVVGLLPERLISAGLPLTGGHGHQTAYEWIARHTGKIEETLKTLATGRGRVKAPFDAVVLVEE